MSDLLLNPAARQNSATLISWGREGGSAVCLSIWRLKPLLSRNRVVRNHFLPSPLVGADIMRLSDTLLTPEECQLCAEILPVILSWSFWKKIIITITFLIKSKYISLGMCVGKVFFFNTLTTHGDDFVCLLGFSELQGEGFSLSLHQTGCVFPRGQLWTTNLHVSSPLLSLKQS